MARPFRAGGGPALATPQLHGPLGLLLDVVPEAGHGAPAGIGGVGVLGGRACMGLKQQLLWKEAPKTRPESEAFGL